MEKNSVMGFMNPFKEKAQNVDTETKEEPKPNLNVYPEKLTHTYTCPKCSHEFKFDPNDGRKFSCKRLDWNSRYSGSYKCSEYGKCCHHYEQIILKPCEQCGEKLDPRSAEQHKLPCIASICGLCGKNAYKYNNGHYVLSDRIIKRGDEYRCVPCFKDDALIEILTKLLEKLNA